MTRNDWIEGKDDVENSLLRKRKGDMGTEAFFLNESMVSLRYIANAKNAQNSESKMNAEGGMQR